MIKHLARIIILLYAILDISWFWKELPPLQQPTANHIRKPIIIVLSTVLLLLSFALFSHPANAQAPIGSGVCTASSLSVRSSPSSSARRLGSISRGAAVSIYQSKNGWYQIGFKSGLGWVSGKYIKYTPGTSTSTPPNTPPGVIGIGKVKTGGSTLNVRSGAGTGYAILGRVSNGSTQNIYQKQGGWYQILYNGNPGWVIASYIAFTPVSSVPVVTPTPSAPASPSPTDVSTPTPVPTVSPSSSPSPPDGTIGTGAVVNVTTFGNVRKGPGTSYAALGKAYPNDVFPVYSMQTKWVEIDFNGQHAWISSSLINVTLFSSDSPIVQARSIYSYEQMKQDIAALKSRYPDQITVSSIGQSVQGKDIPVLVVGNPSAANQILIHAGIHGREYMNPNIVMMQVESMLANPGTVYDGQTNAQWMADSCFHIIPMVNPDGITISQTKSCSSDVLAICTLNLVSSSNLSNYLMLWKANANGVDLNLQFPSGWNEQQSVSKPAGSDYKGDAPMKEPEVLALSAYTQGHSFDITISYHSTGNDIYVEFPLATDALNAKSRSLGGTISALTGYGVFGTPLSEGAGYKDWALSACGIPSVTIETGSVSCPLPLSQFSAIWAKHRNLWPVLVKWARANPN